jgi:hypothetical protein
VLITGLEHHSNIVPWQMLRDQIGIKLVVAPIDRNGNLIWGRSRSCCRPEIAQAMVFGDKRAYLVALIVPDETAVQDWAKAVGLGRRSTMLRALWTWQRWIGVWRPPNSLRQR